MLWVKVGHLWALVDTPVTAVKTPEGDGCKIQYMFCL